MSLHSESLPSMSSCSESLQWGARGTRSLGPETLPPPCLSLSLAPQAVASWWLKRRQRRRGRRGAPGCGP